MFSVFLAVMIEPARFLINRLTRFSKYVVDIDDSIMQISGCIIGLMLVGVFRQMGSCKLKNWPAPGKRAGPDAFTHWEYQQTRIHIPHISQR